MTKGSDMLKEAHRVVGERGKVYGDARENMERTADLWSKVFGHEVTGKQVALSMMMVKVARLIETPDHIDTVVDIAGYAAVYRDCIDEGPDGRTD